MSYYKSKHFYTTVENFNIPRNNNKTLEINKNSISPDVWGSGLWLVLHLGSANYPEKASPIAKDRMKKFIQGLPYILPCDNCFEHALKYIESKKSNLDDICKGKDNLFKFFNEFHNSVNQRTNKQIISLDEAKNTFCK